MKEERRRRRRKKKKEDEMLAEIEIFMFGFLDFAKRSTTVILVKARSF